MNVNLLKPFEVEVILQLLFSGGHAYLLYPPTIGTLEHDGIAIDQYVERINPGGSREASGSQIIWNDEDNQNECRAVAYLGSLCCELDSIKKFLMVSGHGGRFNTYQ